MDLMYNKAKEIKELTITMNDYLEKESKNELEKMNKSFLTNNPLVNRVIEQIDKISANGNLTIYVLMLVFTLFFFITLYFLK